MDIKLVLFKKNGSHKSFPLTSNVTVIGRRHECDLYIPLPTVSRQHCQLSMNGQALEIRDLDSTCGTFVNDRKVDGQTTLKAGDYIRIGPLTFLCQINGKPEKITPPKKPAPPAAKPQKKPAKPLDDKEDSFGDLDASDSFLGLGESDSGLDDLKDL
ncbi:MAG: FHA domain-containing protein [Sedimentisphaerales bacterium]|nr:FHA domain-containing protein [Sedimentisphaerales bacterium]